MSEYECTCYKCEKSFMSVSKHAHICPECKNKSSAIALPKKYKILPGKPANAIAKRLGVKFNGEIRPLDVVEFDVERGYIVTNTGERLTGIVEPFWR